MTLEYLDHLVYLIMRIGTVAFAVIIETTFVGWVALMGAGFLKRSWRKFRSNAD